MTNVVLHISLYMWIALINVVSANGIGALAQNHFTNKPRPNKENNTAVNVFVGFYIESMGNFKDTDMAFDVDMYMRMSWQDTRLMHNESGMKLVTDSSVIKQIWLPDIYFVNARAANFQDVTVPNLSIFIHRDGTVALSRRITMNLACNMNLRRYPMDRQTCFIRIGSYAHIKSEMKVKWFSKDSIDFNKDIDLPEFSVVSMTPTYCEGVFAYAKTERDFQQAQFSCLRAEIQLIRSLTYHLVQSYIPTLLIVVISWISFWIDRNAVPARVSLSFTTLLTLSTMGAGLRYSLPPVSYAKAIDYWYGVCMFFVFGALLEFAIVNNFMRRSQKCANLVEMGRASGRTGSFMAELAEVGVNEASDESHGQRSTSANRDHRRRSNFANQAMKTAIASTPLLTGESRANRSVSTVLTNDGVQLLHFQRLLDELGCRGDVYSRRALKVDQTCRVIFPLTFIMFSLFYWIFYVFN